MPNTTINTSVKSRDKHVKSPDTGGTDVSTKTKPRIVASFTTKSSRIYNIGETLDSVLSQTIPIDMLYINIPNEKIDMKTIKEYSQYIPITINKINDSYENISKLYPVLEKEIDPKTMILLIEDDGIYHKTLLSKLLSVYKKTLHHTKKNSAIGVQGWNTSGKEYKTSKLSSTCTIKPVEILATWAGILLRRDQFLTKERDIKNKLLCKKDRKTGDYVLSKVLHSNSIPRYIIKDVTDKVIEPVTLMESDVRSANEKWNTYSDKYNNVSTENIQTQDYESKNTKKIVSKRSEQKTTEPKRSESKTTEPKRKKSEYKIKKVIRRDTPHSRSAFLKRGK